MVLDLRHVIPSAEFSSGEHQPQQRGGGPGTPVPPVATRMSVRWGFGDRWLTLDRIPSIGCSILLCSI